MVINFGLAVNTSKIQYDTKKCGRGRDKKVALTRKFVKMRLRNKSGDTHTQTHKTLFWGVGNYGRTLVWKFSGDASTRGQREALL